MGESVAVGKPQYEQRHGSLHYSIIAGCRYQRYLASRGDG
jgi:hypothetical protein